MGLLFEWSTALRKITVDSVVVTSIIINGEGTYRHPLEIPTLVISNNNYLTQSHTIHTKSLRGGAFDTKYAR
jgi:hypothetical protein